MPITSRRRDEPAGAGEDGAPECRPEFDAELDPTLALSARGLGKRYQLGELLGLGRMVQATIDRARGVYREPDPFMAVRGADFDVRAGECFGVVGTNGSGKSTIVQLISGITVPTTGVIRTRGRVLPLMEVGAGFHWELTGRENVTLVGTIQGLSPDEIEVAMPRIAEFAEMDEDHMDTPLKRYSMGMQARLSFAIAMRFPADIYIFDEVMAVVDDRFRAICVQEVRRILAEGRTVIFISHDLDLVRSLCNRGLWIDKGLVQMVGQTDEVADAYSAFLAS